MEEIFVFFGFIAVCLVLSGPVALVIAIIALNKAKEASRQAMRPEHFAGNTANKRVTAVKAEPKIKEEAKPEEPIKRAVGEAAVPCEIKKSIAHIHGKLSESEDETKVEVKKDSKKAVIVSRPIEPETLSLEQRIGTKWVLIAGIITLIVSGGFFLKYAYDNSIVGPLGRVIIVAVSGLVAICVGEVTRKRNFDIVAKGVTSLGFALLYASVFSAFRFYDLMGAVPTFVLAFLITVAAMLYAVSLNEMLVAILSLLGGFLTPVLVSTGHNLPMPLFTYVLILGAGAMLCAYWRNWRAVNLLAFSGTVILYAGWFEKFFRGTIGDPELCVQMPIALGWLGVFFAVYLTLPLFNGFVKKTVAAKEDILLVLANAGVTFYYLWVTLYDDYRLGLAFCAIGMCIANLLMMRVVMGRCKKDKDLRLCMLLMGLFFLTIAIPLYLKMYGVAIAWAAEAVVLIFVGLRYRSSLTQIAGAICILLSLERLAEMLPMHTGAFTLIWNPAFGTWAFVSVMIVACHVLYRRSSCIDAENRKIISQVLHCLSVLVLCFAAVSEWQLFCKYNITGDAGISCFINGTLLIGTFFMLLLLIRGVCAAGQLPKIVASALAFAGCWFSLIGLNKVYHDSFVIFANSGFIFAMLFVCGLFGGGWLLHKSTEENKSDKIFARIFGLGGVVLLLALLSMEVFMYWYCKGKYIEDFSNWEFLASMYISVTWAIYGIVLMAVGFWRKMTVLRYISLGLFGVLLLKVFIFDMSTVKSVYRIAAFMATGLSLVGVSYLYQHLKNKGFFDAMLAEKKLQD
jgi:uncharacterized membrane protein